ncbi:MAG: LytTR family DNA-binding domain-containing protein [Spirosomataceae bacterium]
MKLNCVIIDDEPNAVALLEMLIQQSTQWAILGKCYNGLEAMEFLKNNAADFIFLDINMPHLSGMELAGLLSAQTKIVFTTAYAEYAVESYIFQTIDYLLKPITLSRFLGSVKKIEQSFLNKENEPGSMLPSNPDYFFVKTGKSIRNIFIEDILYFEGEREYARLVTKDEQLLIYRRLKDIEGLLPSFVRVHNSFIVNTKQIHKIEDNHVHIGDKRIPVSEKFREGFMVEINKRKF